MSDLGYGKIRIGGQLSRNFAIPFLTAINADYDEGEQITKIDDLINYISDDCLEFSSRQLNAGIFMCLESACQKYRLSYKRESESTDSNEAEVSYWIPGMLEPTTRCANNAGEVLIALSDIRTNMKNVRAFIKEIKNVKGAPLKINSTDEYHSVWAKDILDHNKIDPLRLLSICLDEYFPAEDPELPAFVLIP